jgi:hypothetical protein
MHPYWEHSDSKMKIFLLASMLLLLWAISCNKDKETSGLTIIGGSVCGWCAGSDSVIINESRLNYRNMRSCDHYAYSKVSHMEKSEWDNLTELIDLDAFNNIHLNTCNVCVDGCDKWITIRNGSYSHTIRFGYQDSVAIEPIRLLADRLDSLREAYRNVDDK